MGKIKMPKRKPERKIFEKIKMPEMSRKKLVMLLSAVAVLFIVAVVAVILIVKNTLGGKEESYRSIQIYELEGTATIEREEIGYIDAVENLYLESGDYIYVDEDSYMRLKLDDDKYIMVEENTVFSIVAEGTKEDSETYIDLEEGAITNEIQNKLNENSYYDVTTPNSVMAVRGTIFRVEVIYDENGEVYTKVTTFEGEVETTLILPDGSEGDEVVLVEGGNEVIIYMDDETTEYLSDPEDIDYAGLSVQVLEFLKELMEEGTELPGITLEEMEALIEELSEEMYEDGEYEEDETEISEDDEEETEEDEDEDDEEDEGDEDEDEDDNSAKKSEETKQESYTVTFTYNGAVFGTQTVKKGEKATALKLSPAESGSWDFDFSTPITGDTTISWKQ